MTNQCVTKQFHRLMKNIGSFSDGQAEITDFSDSIDVITITIYPNGGLYKDAEFLFEIELPDSYPRDTPIVSCKTQIYHPNIEAYEGHLHNNVCVNILGDDWTTDTDLESVVQALLYLFYHPDLDDPLSMMFARRCSKEEYEANVKMSLKGGVQFSGIRFQRNIIRAVDEGARKPDGIDRRVKSSENVLIQNKSTIIEYAQQTHSDNVHTRTARSSRSTVTQQRRTSICSYSDIQSHTNRDVPSRQHSQTSYCSFQDVHETRGSLCQSMVALNNTRHRRNSYEYKGRTRRANRFFRFLNIVLRRRSSKYF